MCFYKNKLNNTKIIFLTFSKLPLLFFVVFYLIPFNTSSAEFKCHSVDKNLAASGYDIYSEIANQSGGRILIGDERKQAIQPTYQLDPQIYFNRTFRPSKTDKGYEIPIDSAIKKITLSINRFNSSGLNFTAPGNKTETTQIINRGQCIYQQNPAIAKTWILDNFEHATVFIDSPIEILSVMKANIELGRHGWGIVPILSSSAPECLEFRQVLSSSETKPEEKEFIEELYNASCDTNHTASIYNNGYYWLSLFYDVDESATPESLDKVILHTENGKSHIINIQTCDIKRWQKFSSLGALASPIEKNTGCYFSFAERAVGDDILLFRVNMKDDPIIKAVEIHGKLSNGEAFQRHKLVN